MRIAVLADIHGNLPALEVVIARLETLQPDYVVINGDLINGVPFSTEVIDRVRALGWVVVRGNHEFYYLDFGTERAQPGCEDPVRWGQLHWLVETITPAQGAYLAMLPDERTLYIPGTQPLRIAHGVPGRNRIGFHNRQDDAQIVAEIQEVGERTFVSAHTHVQIDRHLHRTVDQTGAGQHWHLINPGSVGLPLNGDPTVQFAILENVADNVEAGGWQARMERISYDRRPALQAYTESGMLDMGGIITRLFYWEVVTAEPEIVFFYRWVWANGHDADCAPQMAFDAYVAATGRDQYVRRRDPLYQPRLVG